MTAGSDSEVKKKKRKKKPAEGTSAVQRETRLDADGNPVRKKKKRPVSVQKSTQEADKNTVQSSASALKTPEGTAVKKVRPDENGNPVRKKKKRPVDASVAKADEAKTAEKPVKTDKTSEKTPVRKVRLDENGNPIRRKKKRPAEAAGAKAEKKTDATEKASEGPAVKKVRLDENGNPVRKKKKRPVEAAGAKAEKKTAATENASEGTAVKKVRLDENGNPVRKKKKKTIEAATEREIRESRDRWDNGRREIQSDDVKTEKTKQKEKKQGGSIGEQVRDFFTKPATGNRRTIRMLVIADIVLLLLLIIVLSVRHYKKEDTRLSTNSDVTSIENTAESGESDSEGGSASETSFSATDTITILGAGDNLIHSPIYEYAETSDGYDFTYCYEKVSDQISAADIATINQETPLATSVADPSGYPRFNTPQEDGEALIDAGFDIFGIGNNHFADMGSEGVEATLNFFEDAGVPYVGVYWDEDDRDTIRVIEANGIKVAFLNFFSFVNQEIPSGYQFVMLDEPDRMQAQIKLAKEQADIVVVHAHWGEEYQTELTEQETEVAQNLVNWGADIIFGNHPHVLQELTVLTREEDGQKCPVIYSLGNFISGQQQKATMVGGLLTVTVGRDEETGEVQPVAMEFDPVVTQFTEADGADAQVIPLSEYTEEMADSHGILNYEDDFTLDYINNLVSSVIPDEYNGKMGSLS